MAEDNFTLTTFYTSWKAYQDHLKGALAPVLATWYIRPKNSSFSENRCTK